MKRQLIRFACKACGARLAVPVSMGGRSDHCPKCQSVITAPLESEELASARVEKKPAAKKSIPVAETDAPASQDTQQDLFQGLRPSLLDEFLSTPVKEKAASDEPPVREHEPEAREPASPLAEEPEKENRKVEWGPPKAETPAIEEKIPATPAPLPEPVQTAAPSHVPQEVEPEEAHSEVEEQLIAPTWTPPLTEQEETAHQVMGMGHVLEDHTSSKALQTTRHGISGIGIGLVHLEDLPGRGRRRRKIILAAAGIAFLLMADAAVVLFRDRINRWWYGVKEPAAGEAVVPPPSKPSSTEPAPRHEAPPSQKSAEVSKPTPPPEKPEEKKEEEEIVAMNTPAKPLPAPGNTVADKPEEKPAPAPAPAPAPEAKPTAQEKPAPEKTEPPPPPAPPKSEPVPAPPKPEPPTPEPAPASEPLVTAKMEPAASLPIPPPPPPAPAISTPPPTPPPTPTPAPLPEPEPKPVPNPIPTLAAEPKNLDFKPLTPLPVPPVPNTAENLAASSLTTAPAPISLPGINGAPATLFIPPPPPPPKTEAPVPLPEPPPPSVVKTDPSMASPTMAKADTTSLLSPPSDPAHSLPPSPPPLDKPAEDKPPAPLPEAKPDTAPPSKITESGVTDAARPALEALGKFLLTPNWQERLKYCQKKDSIRSAMEKHYKTHADGPINVKQIALIQRYANTKGAPYCEFELRGGELKQPVLVLVDEPAKGTPRVDWEAFVEFKDRLLWSFLEHPGAPAQKFRVSLRRKHYFDKDVPDMDEKESFAIQQPGVEMEGHVFAPSKSPPARQLAQQLGWGSTIPAVILELVWRKDGSHRWVEIGSVVEYGWKN